MISDLKKFFSDIRPNNSSSHAEFAEQAAAAVKGATFFTASEHRKNGVALIFSNDKVIAVSSEEPVEQEYAEFEVFSSEDDELSSTPVAYVKCDVTLCEHKDSEVVCILSFFGEGDTFLGGISYNTNSPSLLPVPTSVMFSIGQVQGGGEA